MKGEDHANESFCDLRRRDAGGTAGFSGQCSQRAAGRATELEIVARDLAVAQKPRDGVEQPLPLVILAVAAKQFAQHAASRVITAARQPAKHQATSPRLDPRLTAAFRRKDAIVPRRSAKPGALVRLAPAQVWRIAPLTR